MIFTKAKQKVFIYFHFRKRYIASIKRQHKTHHSASSVAYSGQFFIDEGEIRILNFNEGNAEANDSMLIKKTIIYKPKVQMPFNGCAP